MPLGSSTRQLSVDKTWPHLQTLDNTKAIFGIDPPSMPLLFSAVYFPVNLPLFFIPSTI